MRRAHRALIVIDMLRDFMEKTGALYCGNRARRIIPFVKRTINKFRHSGEVIIYANDAHTRKDREFRLFPKHCVHGESGAEVIPEIAPTERDIIVPKKSYDATFKSRLVKILKMYKIKDVYLVGVCTSICVMETASSLTKYGFRVHIFEDGVADFDPDAHKFALKRMSFIYGAKIV